LTVEVLRSEMNLEWCALFRRSRRSRTCPSLPRSGCGAARRGGSARTSGFFASPRSTRRLPRPSRGSGSTLTPPRPLAGPSPPPTPSGPTRTPQATLRQVRKQRVWGTRVLNEIDWFQFVRSADRWLPTCSKSSPEILLTLFASYLEY
jgi:hypothetical protein